MAKKDKKKDDLGNLRDLYDRLGEVNEAVGELIYQDDSREAALAVGGVDHTMEAHRIIIELGRQRDQFREAIRMFPDEAQAPSILTLQEALHAAKVGLVPSLRHPFGHCFGTAHKWSEPVTFEETPREMWCFVCNGLDKVCAAIELLEGQ